MQYQSIIFIRRSFFAAVWAATLLPSTVAAFVPGGLKGEVTSGKSHKQMTRDALDVLYAEYGFGTDVWPLNKAMDNAREQIADANAAVDNDYKSVSARHPAAIFPTKTERKSMSPAKSAPMAALLTIPAVMAASTRTRVPVS